MKRRLIALGLAVFAAACGSEEPPDLSTEERLAAPPDLERGRRAFRACAVCHEIAEGAPHRVGPNLHGVTRREAGALPDFAYSRALQAADVVWTEEALDAWIEDPREFLPGTRMSYAGEPDPAERRDLIAYLKSAAR
ncbi:MAG: cytochrome c family protein [Pseudomonadota bacterium]